MKKIKTILADDHCVFLETLEVAFANHPMIEVVGTATNGNRVISLLDIIPADVVVLDISMPEKNGIETAREILKKFRRTKVLLLSMINDYTYIKNVKGIGVHGYLHKGASKSELESAIIAVGLGGEFFKLPVPGPRPPVDPNDFTPREWQVLGYFAKGWGNPQMATALDIKTSTVDEHIKNIRLKTGLGSARELVWFAITQANAGGDLGYPPLK
jgi:DNA-binding NarL/FixJ family response regulator